MVNLFCSPKLIVYFFLCLTRLTSWSDAGLPGVSAGGPAGGSSVTQPAEPAPPPEPEWDTNNTKLYVLMYHHFVKEGESCNTWTVTDARFREDLQWLADHGYTTVLPSELLSGKGLPDKAVMLTFDDGYRSNYELAYPLLQEYQAKAVISIVTQYTVNQSPNFLSWDMCREMAQSGLVEIGSHTNNCHQSKGIQRLPNESREDYQARVFPDIQTSIELIAENVGVEVQFLAYPNGLKDSWAGGFIQERIDMTVTTKAGRADVSNGFYSLPRYNVAMGYPLSNILP